MCLYGNVQRVKFFDKPSYSCLVEYESPEQVEDAISFMKGEFQTFNSIVKNLGYLTTGRLSTLMF